MNMLYRDIGILRKISTRDGTFFSCYIMVMRYFLINITRSIKRISYYGGLSLMSKSTERKRNFDSSLSKFQRERYDR